MDAIHRLGLADLPDIGRIERQAHEYPWSEGQLKDSLAGTHLVWGVREDGATVGFLIWMAILDEVHVLNIAVDPAHRRRGHARGLLTRLMQEAEDTGARHLFLEVRASNQGAIALYESMGLCEMGRRRNYYRCAQGREDALLMGKSW